MKERRERPRQRMSEKYRLLVVEDEFLIALDMIDALEAAGFDVVGPLPSVESAMQVVAASPRAFAGAILDVNLHGRLSFPIADLLKSMQVPFIFTTGYHMDSIPPRFADTPVMEKPVEGKRLANLMNDMLDSVPH